MKKNPTIGDIKTSIQPPPRRPVAWKNTPLTVGTISTEEGLRNLAHPPAGIDLAEVRLDLLLAKGVEPEKIMEAMSKKEIPAGISFLDIASMIFSGSTPLARRRSRRTSARSIPAGGWARLRRPSSVEIVPTVNGVFFQATGRLGGGWMEVLISPMVGFFFKTKFSQYF